MRSTGPILAAGAITMANRVVFGAQPVDWRVPIATGLAAGAFALAEHGWQEGAVAVAWLALFTTIILPTGGLPSPAENALVWWTGKPIQELGMKPVQTFGRK